MQPVSDNFECKYRYAMKAAEKSRAAREKKERANIRERKQKLKKRFDYIRDAQNAFNDYIRARDNSLLCISCNRGLHGAEVGGKFDCGHYRSVGAAPHLRFDERNAHGQCKYCNRHLSGNHVNYRIGLIDRIGLEVVEALEADNEPKHYTIQDLIDIKEKYKRKLKELKSRKILPAKQPAKNMEIT